MIRQRQGDLRIGNDNGLFPPEMPRFLWWVIQGILEIVRMKTAAWPRAHHYPACPISQIPLISPITSASTSPLPTPAPLQAEQNSTLMKFNATKVDLKATKCDLNRRKFPTCFRPKFFCRKELLRFFVLSFVAFARFSLSRQNSGGANAPIAEKVQPRPEVCGAERGRS